MYNTTIGSLSAFLYLLTGGLLGVRLSQAKRGPLSGKSWLVGLGAIAVALHAWILIHEVLTPAGINLGFFNALSCTGWLIAVTLLIAALVKPVENLGIILLPFSALTLLLTLLFPSQQEQLEALQWPMQLHIFISIFAYAFFALAAVQALLLGLQNYALRHRHLSGFVRAIPALTTMETLLFQLIGFGFVLLSLALLSGFLFLKDIFAQHLVHKTTLSIAAWLVFAILLWCRWRYGWRGRTAIRWTLSGFVTLVLAYFGSKMVLELILQR